MNPFTDWPQQLTLNQTEMKRDRSYIMTQNRQLIDNIIFQQTIT